MKSFDFICRKIAAPFIQKKYMKKSLSIQELDIWVTKKCNARCFFCPIIHSVQESDEISIQELIKSVEILKNTFVEISRINIFGGEPLLKRDFAEMINYLNGQFPNTKLRLFTNGILINKDINLLDKFETIYVSLHSITNYELIFGIDKAKIVIENLANLPLNIKNKVVLSIGLNNINENDLTEIFDLALELGINTINVFPVRHDFDKAYGIMNELTTNDELNFPLIIKKIDKYRNRLIIEPNKGTLKQIEQVFNQKSAWVLPCNSPFYKLILDYSGDIRLCCGNQPPIGNVFKLDFNNFASCNTVVDILDQAIFRKGTCRYCLIGSDSGIISASNLISKIKKRIKGGNL